MQGGGGGGGGKQAVLWEMCKLLISACVDIVERWLVSVTFGAFKKGLYHSCMLPTYYKLRIFYVLFLNASTLWLFDFEEVPAV